MKNIQTVFITKYCLTSSIFKIEAEIRESFYGKRYAYGRISGGSLTGFFNNDFHFTEEEALKDAENRRKKKIESLKKQMMKIEEKKFVIV